MARQADVGFSAPALKGCEFIATSIAKQNGSKRASIYCRPTRSPRLWTLQAERFAMKKPSTHSRAPVYSPTEACK